MIIKMDGKPFSGVTYNQGQFTGTQGHLFIAGEQQCSYGLNYQARNRIWDKVRTWSQLESLISGDDICKQCAKNATSKIATYRASA
jgi:hypothetical protein